METSFPLPNKVGCSDVRKPTQTNLDQIEMIRTKYNRVNAERTRALGSSKAKPDGTLKTLAHHEMKLKILKLVLACVAVATFLNIAAFGGLFYYLTKRMGSNERACETMQEGVATLQIQISKQTSNSSDAEDTSINLFISEFQQIQTRIDTLELIANTHDTDLSHLETVTNVHGERLENITDQTADLQSNISAVSTALELRMTTTTEEIKANLTSQGVILATLNDTVMKLILLTNELSNSSQTESAQLVQLEADMNSSEAMFQEIASRVIDFESNITADRALVLSLQTEMANMQANLTSATQLIKTHGDIIFTINKTVIQMVGVINQSNNNSQAAEELIADLEAKIESKLLQIKSDIEANRGNVKENTDKIKLLEANVTSEKDKSEILSSNITYLETEIGTVKAAIQNNDAGIINNSDKIRLFNYSVTAHMDIAKTLRSNVTDLELEIGTLKAAIQSNNNAIACSVTNIAELDNSTSESISKLANSLIDVTDALNCTWTDWEPFSMCSQSCGGGTQYRTRRCQSTNQLSQDWFPRTETDLQLCNNHSCSDNKSAFTAKLPSAGARFGEIRFTTIVTNIGHYSGTSGKFTCQHPGLYVFLLYIYKDVGDTTAQCYIRKNGYNMIAASSTDTASSYIAGSNAVILHLSHSDYVDVGGCTSIDTISRGWDTSFTGFLLQED